MRGAVLAGAVTVMLGSGVGIAAASPSGAVSPGASAASVWSVMPTPAVTNGRLVDMSCTSASACTAVGRATAGTASVTLAERWNGTAWAVQATPSPGGARGSYLYGVACTSDSACIAVGQYGNSRSTNAMLAERWNGTRWSVLPTSTTLNGGLQAVSCISASSCTAVGEKVTSAGAGVTLAEHWNGTAWALQATPNPRDGGVLDGVSCPSASACTAVGYYEDVNGNEFTLAEQWNGTAWSIHATPGAAGSTELTGVSCTSASSCTAVGWYFLLPEGPGGTVAEHWNGTAWTSQRIPTPRGNNGDGEPEAVLDTVSCTSASACMAVGWYFNLNITQVTLAEQWNGTAWVIQRPPNPGKAGGARELDGVSCTSASACTAAGAWQGGGLAERYGPAA